MQKSKYYYKTFFSGPIIQEAIRLYHSMIGGEKNLFRPRFSIKSENETWNLDSIEEFFSEYPKSDSCYLNLDTTPKVDLNQDIQLIIQVYPGKNTEISVGAKNRKNIETLFQIFEKNLDKCKIVIERDPIKIFIGHGNDEQWRLLKDYLHDQNGFEVIAYEIGPRAGLSVKEVLEDMLNKSSIAFLVLTGEDLNNYGEVHARQNVVHELGLFQGRLGFKRAIALLEEDVMEFSNINGVNQIRFSKGNIRETFGDVITTIKREFEK